MIRDPVVVMVLSLGFIASVFLLQYCPLPECTDGLVSLQNSRRNGLVDIAKNAVRPATREFTELFPIPFENERSCQPSILQKNGPIFHLT